MPNHVDLLEAFARTVARRGNHVAVEGPEGTLTYGELDVWTRPLSGGATAIAVINAGADRYSTHPFHLSLARLGLHGPLKGKDLWTGKDITLTDNMPIELASHDILLVRIASPK